MEPESAGGQAVRLARAEKDIEALFVRTHNLQKLESDVNAVTRIAEEGLREIKAVRQELTERDDEERRELKTELDAAKKQKRIDRGTIITGVCTLAAAIVAAAALLVDKS